MGKRKSAKKPPPKKKNTGKVPTEFSCPFCNGEDTVECNIDKTKNIGTIRCRICSADYQMVTNYLTEPIDIFSEWIDECERVKAAKDDEDE